MEHVRLRMGLQNKCIEISITITSGLAAAVAGAAIAVVAKSTGPAAFPDFMTMRLPLVLVLGLYGLLQSLLLTNYIYHTFILACINSTYLSVRRKAIASLAPELVSVVERASKQRQELHGWKEVRSWIFELLHKFQPCVLYASAASAWLVETLVLILPSPQLLPLWLAILIMLFLWCSLLVLLWLHINAGNLAVDFAISSFRQTSSK